MSYEEVMLARQANQIDKTRANLLRHRSIVEAASYEEDQKSIYDKLYSQNFTNAKYDKFKESVKESYLVEALTIFVDNCLEPHIVKEQYNQKLARQLVSNFVEQTGADNLLRKMRGTSYLMSELAFICDKAYTATLEATDKNNEETFKLKKEVDDKFYNDLSKTDVDESINTIANRVRESTTDFVQNNISDKAKIVEALDKAESKVEKTKAKLAPDASDNAKQENEKIQESYIHRGQREVMDIREGSTKNVFEAMVYNLSKTALVNENAKQVFVENSRLNVEKIVEHCEVMYTFMVAMDSTKLLNIDESFIDSMLKDLKSK